MLSSYPVACPHEECSWRGNLVPSVLQGRISADIAPMHRAWFQCPHCRRDWEVRLNGDQVTVLPVAEKGG